MDIGGSDYIPHEDPSQFNAAAAAGGPSSSEAGKIAQELGAVINGWENKLGGALQNWYDSAQEIQQIISNVKNNYYVKAFEFINEEYKWVQNKSNPSGYVFYFSSAQKSEITNLMVELGIPPSQIQGGAYSSGASPSAWGPYAYTGSQLAHDMQLIKGDLVDNPVVEAAMDKVEQQINQAQHQETQDMLDVMYDFTAIQTNQKTLAGILNTLKSMYQAVDQNVQ